MSNVGEDVHIQLSGMDSWHTADGHRHWWTHVGRESGLTYWGIYDFHLAICTSERHAQKTGAMHMDVNGSHSCHYLKSESNKLVRTVTITQRNIITMTVNSSTQIHEWVINTVLSGKSQEKIRNRVMCNMLSLWKQESTVLEPEGRPGLVVHTLNSITWEALELESSRPVALMFYEKIDFQLKGQTSKTETE